MTQITEALIRKHFDDLKSLRRQWLFSGWFVELKSGASVKISRRGIDFGKYREIENRRDFTAVQEFFFQCEFRDSIALGYEIWGGIGLYGKGKVEDRAAILKYAESIGVDTGDQGLIFRYFGAAATIKYHWFCGWTVNLPNGSAVKVRGGAIEEVRGGGDIFRTAMRLIHEIAPDNVVIVRGKPGFVLMGINHGKAIGIDIVPESDLAIFRGITGAVVQIACFALACCWFDLLTAAGIGLAGGLLLCMIGGGLFGKQLQAMARKRGQGMLGLEATDNDTRKASIADAKAKGML